MLVYLTTDDGGVTDLTLEHYRQRARGVGLVIVELSTVTYAGRAWIAEMGAYRDELVPGLRRLAETIRGEGAKVVIQIGHGGPRGLNNFELGLPISPLLPAGPSAVPLPGSNVYPRALSTEEVEEIVVAFGDAAERAVEAGFDGVEVHGAHGYLNHGFVSPYTNRRTDKYGGSRESRMRLPVEIVEEIRRRVGSDYPVMYRLGAFDGVEGGLTVEDAQDVARALVEAGVDGMEVSGGYGRPSAPMPNRPRRPSRPVRPRQGFMIPKAAKIQQAVDVPVVGVGGVTEPEYADQIVREGRVSMVGVGRGMLTDPQWALHAAAELSGA
jgi:2,4-dienoyl-CoA reductase-like NADH-dependent reductase (Old Yellow Enzyme family)